MCLGPRLLLPNIRDLGKLGRRDTARMNDHQACRPQLPLTSDPHARLESYHQLSPFLNPPKRPAYPVRPPNTHLARCPIPVVSHHRPPLPLPPYPTRIPSTSISLRAGYRASVGIWATGRGMLITWPRRRGRRWQCCLCLVWRLVRAYLYWPGHSLRRCRLKGWTARLLVPPARSHPVR